MALHLTDMEELLSREAAHPRVNEEGLLHPAVATGALFQGGALA
jgi:hypothetical protein